MRPKHKNNFTFINEDHSNENNQDYETVNEKSFDGKLKSNNNVNEINITYCGKQSSKKKRNIQQQIFSDDSHSSQNSDNYDRLPITIIEDNDIDQEEVEDKSIEYERNQPQQNCLKDIKNLQNYKRHPLFQEEEDKIQQDNEEKKENEMIHYQQQKKQNKFNNYPIFNNKVENQQSIPQNEQLMQYKEKRISPKYNQQQFGNQQRQRGITNYEQMPNNNAQKQQFNQIKQQVNINNNDYLIPCDICNQRIQFTEYKSHYDQHRRNDQKRNQQQQVQQVEQQTNNNQKNRQQQQMKDRANVRVIPDFNNQNRLQRSSSLRSNSQQKLMQQPNLPQFDQFKQNPQRLPIEEQFNQNINNQQQQQHIQAPLFHHRDRSSDRLREYQRQQLLQQQQQQQQLQMMHQIPPPFLQHPQQQQQLQMPNNFYPPNLENNEINQRFLPNQEEFMIPQQQLQLQQQQQFIQQQQQMVVRDLQIRQRMMHERFMMQQRQQQQIDIPQGDHRQQHMMMMEQMRRIHHQHQAQKEKQQKGMKKEEIQLFSTMKYNKEQSKNLDEEARKCSICLLEFEDQEEIRFLACFHRFHSQCIDYWLDKHSTCPLCKKDLKIMIKEMSDLVNKKQ